MPERWLTFAEVEETLGLTAEEVRGLMEARKLRGQIVDGVVKFGEGEVRKLARAEGPAEAHFKFLVDEEEEKRIEGQAYDGESLAPPKPIERIVDDEEIVEPEALTEELLRNAELLGGKDIVAFGKEVADRSRAEEFKPAELADFGPEKDEEIVDPSSVALPDVAFGPLAERIGEARREEPPEAAAIRVPEPEAQPAPEAPEKKLDFVAEESGPMVCPVTDEAKAESAKPHEAAPVELKAPEKIDFVEAPSAPASEPVAETPAGTYEVEETEVPESALAPEAESVMPAPPVSEPAETYEVVPPAPVAPVTEGFDRAVDEESSEIAPEPSVEEPISLAEGQVPLEQYLAQLKAVAPESAPPELAAQEPAAEEISSVEPSPIAPAPEPVVEAASVPIEPAPLEAAPEPSIAQPIAAQDVTPATAPPERVKIPVSETPALSEPVVAGPAVVSPDEARRRGEEIDAELSQIATKESLPEGASDGRIPTSKSGEIRTAASGGAQAAEVSHEEAKPVTDKTKPTPEEQKKKKPDEIEVFDLGEVKAEPEEEFQILEEEPKEVAPAGPAKEKTLEEEMAELFGEETPQQPAAAPAASAAPAAPKAEEDFDLSVFQKDKQEAVAPAPVEITEEALFDVSQQTQEPAGEQSLTHEDMESQSRIKSLTEERTPASVYFFTAAIVLSFIAVALTGMLLWHVYITK